MSGENGAPSYADYRRKRSEEPRGTGLKFLKAKEFPNGLDVTVLRVEMRPGYVPEGAPPSGEFSPYWVVKAAEVSEPEAYVKESGFMTGKLEDLSIPDATGKRFILSSTEYKGQKTWQIARAL